jgi:hypothetical protein
MTTFAEFLLEATGTASDAYDIRVVTRRLFFYDFDGYPIRVWDGVGKLYAGGHEWLGTIDASGNNRHSAPMVRDPRDGASPSYTFSLPYVDKQTYDGLKADQLLAKGRDLTCYYCGFLTGEGLRPSPEIRFNYRLTIRSTEFSQRVEFDGVQTSVVYSASVQCRSLEAGRSRLPSGVYGSASQIERARLLGLPSDTGCDFVAANSRRTYVLR